MRTSAFTDGLYSGYNAESASYDQSSWDYEIGDDGFAKVDPTLQNPRCVYQLMKQHYSRYTPEHGRASLRHAQGEVPQGLRNAGIDGRTRTRRTILYALGWTHHSVGSQIIRTGAMVQLLLGNIGIAGGGMNALRGHSNIQGLTDLRPDVEPVAGLYDFAEGSRAGLRRLHREARNASRCGRIS